MLKVPKVLFKKGEKKNLHHHDGEDHLSQDPVPLEMTVTNSAVCCQNKKNPNTMSEEFSLNPTNIVTSCKASLESKFCKKVEIRESSGNVLLTCPVLNQEYCHVWNNVGILVCL